MSPEKSAGAGKQVTSQKSEIKAGKYKSSGKQFCGKRKKSPRKHETGSKRGKQVTGRKSEIKAGKYKSGGKRKKSLGKHETGSRRGKTSLYSTLYQD